MFNYLTGGYYKRNEHHGSNAVINIAVVVTVVVMSASVGLALRFRRQRRKTKNELSALKSELSMINGERIQMISNEDSTYPDWLKARKEMLFSSNNLERGDKLGNGNYGSVYKGKLFQGKAV